MLNIGGMRAVASLIFSGMTAHAPLHWALDVGRWTLGVEYGVRGRRRMDCGSGSRLGRRDENGRAFRVAATDRRYRIVLPSAIQGPSFLGVGGWGVDFPFYAFRVRSPCSINFQNSRRSPNCASSEVGSLLRKRKSRSVFLCRTRWIVIPSSVCSK